MNKKPKKTITTCVSEETYEIIKQMAIQEERSMSNMAATIIKRYLLERDYPGKEDKDH